MWNHLAGRRLKRNLLRYFTGLLVVVIVLIICIVRIGVVRAICVGSRRGRGQVILLQSVVTLTHIGRHLVEVCLGFDWTAEKQFALRILRREQFSSVHVRQFELAFVV